jgi:hypothetical protein
MVMTRWVYEDSTIGMAWGVYSLLLWVWPEGSI